MTIHTVPETGIELGFAKTYLEALALVECLRRLFLEVLKDDFWLVNVLEINPVQALLLNIGENEVTAGELKSCGYYQGTKVSCNRKKMAEIGDMHHQRSEIDHRLVRVCLTQQGCYICEIVADLCPCLADGIQDKCGLEPEDIATALLRIER